MKRNNILLILLSIILASFSTMTKIWNGQANTPVLWFIVYFGLFTFAIFMISKNFTKLKSKLHFKKWENILYQNMSDRKFYLFIWSVIVIFWIPAYLALFPGTFGYDAPAQLLQIMGKEPLSSHHPVLHTFILELFLRFGNTVMGSYNVGVALYCAFQGIIVAESIAYSFLIFKRKKIAFPVLVLSLLWCTFHPVIQGITFNITKDVLFGAAFLHFVIDCYNHIFKIIPDSIISTIKILIFGVLVCLLRNQGIYIIAVYLIIYFICSHKDVRFVATLLSIVIISYSFFNVSYHCFNIEKGNKKEMLSVPMQQLATVCKNYVEGKPTNISEEDFRRFSDLVSPEFLPTLVRHSADNIKTAFNTDEFIQNKAEFIRLYFRVGVHNLGTYINAFGAMVTPYWDITITDVSGLSLVYTFADVSEPYGIKRQSIIPIYLKVLEYYIWVIMPLRIPFISWIAQPGICLWILPIIFVISILKKDKRLSLIGLIPALFFGTLLLGPVALMRYIYPLTIMTPWMVAVCITDENRFRS